MNLELILDGKKTLNVDATNMACALGILRQHIEQMERGARERNILHDSNYNYKDDR